MCNAVSTSIGRLGRTTKAKEGYTGSFQMGGSLYTRTSPVHPKGTPSVARTAHSHRQKQLNSAHQEQLLKRNKITSIRSRKIIDLATYLLCFVTAHQTICPFSNFQRQQNFPALSLMRIESTNVALGPKQGPEKGPHRGKAIGVHGLFCHSGVYSDYFHGRPEQRGFDRGSQFFAIFYSGAYSNLCQRGPAGQIGTPPKVHTRKKLQEQIKR